MPSVSTNGSLLDRWKNRPSSFTPSQSPLFMLHLEHNLLEEVNGGNLSQPIALKIRVYFLQNAIAPPQNAIAPPLNSVIRPLNSNDAPLSLNDAVPNSIDEALNAKLLGLSTIDRP